MKHNYFESLLKSYNELGVINRFDQFHFPTQKSIMHIIDLLKELLFPGFFGEFELNHDQLEDLTKNRLKSLSNQLVIEIGKSLQWKKHVSENGKEKQEILLEAEEITHSFLSYLPDLRAVLKCDTEALFEGDPAAKSINEVAEKSNAGVSNDNVIL